ncbi:restriction endonuclease [Metamycoplasma phocicerebrale]|uniref:type II site-specific deoxyribonuclease n=1 Tax=Metamycoplasma phocicerebrale TaxID=142649 RepID=A0A3Q9VBW3_9BACT|nr:restriction endonuclease [Metamycoplasma phocicerebrale]AZZ65727.1 restriction endonuclease [Metamycoplasma phocicerebrale]
MILKYEEFCDLIIHFIDEGQDFYLNLLKKMIDNPSRFLGHFRLTTLNEKIIQNVSQSKEIKFGAFIESIVSKYIEKIGGKILKQHLGKNEKQEDFWVDNLFLFNDELFLLEMKIRDDHDSSKKRGQYSNFRGKVELAKKNYNNLKINAIMWFVDPLLIKNKKYYLSKMTEEKNENCSFYLFYGKEIFVEIFNNEEPWNELVSYIEKYKNDTRVKNLKIFDINNNEEIYNAMIKLPNKYWNKLISNDQKYIILRKSLFKDDNLLKKVQKLRT